MKPAALAFAAGAACLEVLALAWLNRVTAPAPPPPQLSEPVPVLAPQSLAPPPPSSIPELSKPTSLPQALAPAALPSLPSLPALADAHGLPPLSLGLPGLGGLGVGLPGSGGGAVAQAPAAASGPERAAVAIARPPPRYPRVASERGIEGEVLVRLRIEADGSVSDAVVVRADPAGIFDDAALAAARRYRFRPALKGGVAEPSTLEQRILFRIQR